MPFPIAAAMAAASVGSGIFGNLFNANQQKKANKAQMEFQREMYDRQRKDSLADWQMQADYNSPRAQMQRLKEAGLNPNMVYGSGADATMGDVRSSSPGSYNPQAPQFDSSFVPQSLSMMYDLQLKDAQKDNLAAARAVQEQDVLLKAAQIQKTLADTKSVDFDTKMKNDLKKINVNMAAQQLNKLTADVGNASTDLQLKTDTYQELKKTVVANAEKAQAEAKKALNEAGASNHLEKRVIQEIDNLKKDGDLKDFSIKLNKLGLTQSDPVYLRIVAALFGEERIKGLYNKFGRALDKF